MSMQRVMTWSGLVLLGLAGCASEQESSGAAAGASPKHQPTITATRVEVATIKRSQPMATMIRPGEVEGAREANLAAALGGFVEAVKVHSGDEVKAGQAIAYVDTSTHNAQARLTKVEVDDAKRELARLERLGKSVASVRVDAARVRVERANAQHALSRTRQNRAVIRAPFAGVIVDLTVERGEVVGPGAPVARLIQLDPAHVTVSVADRDIANLRAGSTAQVTAAGSPEPIAGVVKRLEPAADLRTRTFMVEVEVGNPDRKLLAGMIAEVTFRTHAGAEAILLPQDLLVTRREGNGVYVVGDGDKAEWRPLKLGAVMGTQIEVLAGLKVGQRVVTQGQRSLSPGDLLMVTRAGECCTDGRLTYKQLAGQSSGQSPGQSSGTPSGKPSTKPSTKTSGDSKRPGPGDRAEDVPPPAASATGGGASEGEAGGAAGGEDTAEAKERAP